MTDKDNITLPREVAELIENLMHHAYNDGVKQLKHRSSQTVEAEEALRTALAAEQPKPEPVAWMESPHGAIRANPNYRLNFPSQLLHWQIPLYTAPPDAEALRRDAELGRWIREETPPIEEIAARVDAMEDKR